MIGTEDIRGVAHGNVHGSDGEKIGSVGQVYLDNQSGQPAWVTVKTGMFGSKASFVPLAEATVDGSDLRVPYDKETVKHAPNVDADGELTPAEEDELYRYYGVDSGEHAPSEGDNSDSGPNARRGEETAEGTAAAGGVAGVGHHEHSEHSEHKGQRDRLEPSDRSEHGEGHEGDGGLEHGEGHEGDGGLEHGDHRRAKPERQEQRPSTRGESESADVSPGRRIRRYIVTEEVITRREEIPAEAPRDTDR